ncbi:PspC domain-containing protein, partial [Streptomyces sp. NPDC054844]
MPEAAAAAPLVEPRPPRKLYRSSDGRWLGGVARGLAGHLGLPVIWVRFAFVGLFMADGLGALLYAAFWFFVP